MKRKNQNIGHYIKVSNPEGTSRYFWKANQNNAIIPIGTGIAGFFLGRQLSGTSEPVDWTGDGEGVTVLPEAPFTGGYTAIASQSGNAIAFDNSKTVVVTPNDVATYFDSMLSSGSAPAFHRFGAALRIGKIIELEHKLQHANPTRKHGIICTYSQMLVSTIDRPVATLPGSQLVEFNKPLMSVGTSYVDAASTKSIATACQVFKRRSNCFKQKDVFHKVAQALTLVSGIIYNSSGDTVGSMMPRTTKGVVHDIINFFDPTMVSDDIRLVMDFDGLIVLHNPVNGSFIYSYRRSNDADFSYAEFHRIRTFLITKFLN